MSKPSLSALVAASALLAATAVHAAPSVPDDGRLVNYAMPAEVLTDFHGGVQGMAADRHVKDHGLQSEMKAQRLNAYLGYDIARWFSIYALGGVLSVKNNDIGLDNDTSFLFGAGAWAALIDDAQLDFLHTISRYRLNAAFEVSYADPNDLAWMQVDASLTFGIYNDSILSDGKFPTAIGIFAGPVFSAVDMDGYKQVEDNEWGFTVGGEMRFANGVYVSGGYDFFNDDNIGYFQAGVRF